MYRNKFIRADNTHADYRNKPVTDVLVESWLPVHLHGHHGSSFVTEYRNFRSNRQSDKLFSVANNDGSNTSSVGGPLVLAELVSVISCRFCFRGISPALAESHLMLSPRYLCFVSYQIILYS